jgi:hypothetical protein
MDITKSLEEYFVALDASIDKLAHLQEHKVLALPAWVLATRRITVAQLKGKPDFYMVKTVPDADLSQDEITVIEVDSRAEIEAFGYPYWTNPDAYYAPKNVSLSVSYNVMKAGDVNAVPQRDTSGVFSWVSTDQIAGLFSAAIGMQDAFNLWNGTQSGIPGSESFVQNAQEIFTRFRQVVKRKGWLERRIHRYLYEYRGVLLPFDFVECHTEGTVRLGAEVRHPDLILKRPSGQRALLIELENTTSRLFRNNKEYTAEANHAKAQISEWVRFIDANPENAQGAMSFLSGPKDRLVIIGRGLENRGEMEASRHDDTLMWTYDYLIEVAKDKINRQILQQYSLLGISNPNLIH